MFSKFLRRISVAVIGVIFLLGAFSGMSLCAKAQSPGTGELEVFQIEQVRAEMPQIQVYVRGVNANEACEAYLDGNALTSTGNQSLDENGTSYLIMLDISGSITSEYFLAAKKQVEELAQNLGPKDKITLITFGDTVKMQVSDSQNADEISKILALLQAKDKKTNLYRAFDQCLKYVEAESQKERQIVLVISDGIQDTGDAGITQEELETRLTQASMPVYAFCVDTADRQSRDGLGTFARTTGGELFVFGPQNAAQVWQKWKERLNQTVCLGFESTANYADGELHTLLLKETAGAQSDTRQIRITNWLVDDTAPEVISFRYDNEKNTIEIEFSEPVLGADKAYAAQGKTDEASEVLNKAQEVFENDAEFLPEFLKDANLVYENGGGNSPFQFLSNQYWDDTNSIFAKDVSDAWLEAEPDNAEPYALLGAYYSAQDDENGIVELLKKAEENGVDFNAINQKVEVNSDGSCTLTVQIENFMQEEAGKSSSVKVELDSKDNAKTATQKVAEKVADSAASKVVKDSGLTGDAASVANSMAQEALRKGLGSSETQAASSSSSIAAPAYDPAQDDGTDEEFDWSEIESEFPAFSDDLAS